MRTRVSALRYQPKIYANIKGAMIEASTSTTMLVVNAPSLNANLLICRTITSAIQS